MFSIKFGKNVSVQSVNDDEVVFSDGTKLQYYHARDCCEHVYADFKAILDQPIMAASFDELKIEGIEDFGIDLGYSGSYGYPMNHCKIPCYNVQNGYYSSDLELIITSDGASYTFDISKYVKDEID